MVVLCIFQPNKYTHNIQHRTHKQICPFFMHILEIEKLWNFLKISVPGAPNFSSPISHTSLFIRSYDKAISLLHTHTLSFSSLSLSQLCDAMMENWMENYNNNGEKKENSSLTSLRQHEWKEENKYYLCLLLLLGGIDWEMWKKGRRRSKSSQCTLKQRDDGRREFCLIAGRGVRNVMVLMLWSFRTTIGKGWIIVIIIVMWNVFHRMQIVRIFLQFFFHFFCSFLCCCCSFIHSLWLSSL